MPCRQKEQDRPHSQKVAYVTKNHSELLALGLTNKGLHHPTKVEGSLNCILWRLKAQKDPAYKQRTATKFKCGFCNVILCFVARDW